MIKIWADFNAMTPDRTKVPIWDTSFSVVKNLQAGLTVTLYQDEDDFEVDGTIEIEHDEHGREWQYAIIDWESFRDISTPNQS